jgi:hypothetical protein
MRRDQHRGHQCRSGESARRDATAAWHRRGAWATACDDGGSARDAARGAPLRAQAPQGVAEGPERTAARFRRGRRPRCRASRPGTDTRRLRSAPMSERVSPRAYVRPQTCAGRQKNGIQRRAGVAPH